ncbi:MAG TPA: serine/threonine-protein kinase, partial [Nannocystis sp.]
MATTQWTLPEQFDEYRLVRMLGRGSMGVVFLGHDLVLDRPVAIKFLNAVDANTRARERFLTEARAAARIQHPNVMGIYRVGELEGRLYIIGEYIRGESLNELPRPMPWQEVLKLAVGLARGLACAHRQGVLHRDIKLANAMRSESGEVKLLDFSLAKLLEGGPMSGPMPAASTSAGRIPSDPEKQDPEATEQLRLVIGKNAKGRRADPAPGVPVPAAREGVALDSTVARAPARPSVLPPPPPPPNINDSSDSSVVGTPYYMAPELWRSQPASRGSDVYALGVLLYILCYGMPPIEGSTTIELARRSQEVVPKPLRSVAPAVDARFAEIVDRCLRPPAERYPSADELCTALETLALGAGPAEVVRGNPYRGLQAFEARHRA